MDPVTQSGDSLEMIFDAEIQGDVQKILQPSTENNAKFQELKQFLLEWINKELKQEHIVVKSLEEDLFDEKIGQIKLDVEEITLTASNQRRKLGVILAAVSECLELEESQLKWNMSLIHNKDLLATLHLLVALANHFQPDLPLPSNVSVEVIVVEPTRNGMKTGKAIEVITSSRDEDATPKKDAFDQLFDLNPDKIKDVIQVMVHFVNKQLVNLSLTVTDLDTQFADGVILLLLIGQLEGYFLNLGTFYLTPKAPEERLHNVTLALDLLTDGGVLHNPVDPTEIVNGDLKTTLRVLYSLFLKHKNS